MDLTRGVRHIGQLEARPGGVISLLWHTPQVPCPQANTRQSPGCSTSSQQIGQLAVLKSLVGLGTVTALTVTVASAQHDF